MMLPESALELNGLLKIIQNSSDNVQVERDEESQNSFMSENEILELTYYLVPLSEGDDNLTAIIEGNPDILVSGTYSGRVFVPNMVWAQEVTDDSFSVRFTYLNDLGDKTEEHSRFARLQIRLWKNMGYNEVHVLYSFPKSEWRDSASEVVSAVMKKLHFEENYERTAKVILA